MTADATITELPAAGRHVVRTLHATYELDMDARTFTAHGSDKARPLHTVRCKLRQPMTITYHTTGRLNYINTTPVQAIESRP